MQKKVCLLNKLYLSEVIEYCDYLEKVYDF